jgi:hypothetical protein
MKNDRRPQRDARCLRPDVNLADRFVRIIDDTAPNDLGCPVTGRHLLHIDLGDLYRPWNAMRIYVCGKKNPPNIATLASNIVSSWEFSMAVCWLMLGGCQSWRLCRIAHS